MEKKDNEDSPGIKDVVKKEATSQISKLAIYVIIALISAAGVGWGWYLKKMIVTIAGGVPTNGVVAFDQAVCPEGWIEYTDLAGRVIVGKGKGNGLKERSYRDKGGLEEYSLTRNELPSHGHEFLGNTYNKGGIGGGPENKIAVGDSSNHGTVKIEGRIFETGKGHAHQNMQPFLVLTYCKRK